MGIFPDVNGHFTGHFSGRKWVFYRAFFRKCPFNKWASSGKCPFIKCAFSGHYSGKMTLERHLDKLSLFRTIPPVNCLRRWRSGSESQSRSRTRSDPGCSSDPGSGSTSFPCRDLVSCRHLFPSCSFHGHVAGPGLGFGSGEVRGEAS